MGLTYVSILESYTSFGEGQASLCVSKKSFIFVNIQNIFIIFTCSSRLCLYVSVFVHLFVQQCVVVQLSVSYGNINVFKRPPNDDSSQLSKFHFPCNKGERSSLYSFFRECNIITMKWWLVRYLIL